MNTMYYIITRFRCDKLRFRQRYVFAAVFSDTLRYAYYRDLFGGIDKPRFDFERRYEHGGAAVAVLGNLAVNLTLEKAVTYSFCAFAVARADQHPEPVEHKSFQILQNAVGRKIVFGYGTAFGLNEFCGIEKRVGKIKRRKRHLARGHKPSAYFAHGEQRMRVFFENFARVFQRVYSARELFENHVQFVCNDFGFVENENRRSVLAEIIENGMRIFFGKRRNPRVVRRANSRADSVRKQCGNGVVGMRRQRATYGRGFLLAEYHVTRRRHKNSVDFVYRQHSCGVYGFDVFDQFVEKVDAHGFAAAHVNVENVAAQSEVPFFGYHFLTGIARKRQFVGGSLRRNYVFARQSETKISDNFGGREFLQKCVCAHNRRIGTAAGNGGKRGGTFARTTQGKTFAMNEHVVAVRYVNHACVGIRRQFLVHAFCGERVRCDVQFFCRDTTCQMDFSPVRYPYDRNGRKLPCGEFFFAEKGKRVKPFSHTGYIQSVGNHFLLFSFSSTR